MKTNPIKNGLLAAALLLTFGFTSSVFAHSARVDINVGVVAANVGQDAFASAFGNEAVANATAANGIVSVADTVDQNVGMNVGIATDDISQNVNAFANSYGYGYGYGGATANATAANAVASLTASPASPAINAGVFTEDVSQNTSAMATNFTYDSGYYNMAADATANATAANAIVTVAVH